MWWLWTCLAGFGLGPVRPGVLPAAQQGPGAGARGSEPTRRPADRVRTSRGRRWSTVSITWPGSGCGSCFLASCTSEWAPQPWSSETTRPSSLALPLAQTPNISDSGPAIRTRKPQVVHVSGAACASGDSGRRRRRTTARAARSRPSGESVRTRPRPRSLATLRICALSSSSSGSSPKEYVGTSRGSSSSTGSRSPGRQVAGLDPLAVGHPLRGDDRLLAGDQHDLVDGDRLLAGGPGHGDRPAPAGVARAGAREEMGDDALALDHVAEVLADVGGADLLDQGGARLVDRRHGGGVGLGCARLVITGEIIAHRARACQVGARSVSRSCRRGLTGQDG